MAKSKRSLFRFEKRGERLATRTEFAGRLGLSLVAACVLIGASLALGMTGYIWTEGMDVVDAFANAAMILSGMGPLQPLTTDAGKIFAGLYAIFSGLALVLVSGIILAPVAHRVLHSLHVPDEA